MGREGRKGRELVDVLYHDAATGLRVDNEKCKIHIQMPFKATKAKYALLTLTPSLRPHQIFQHIKGIINFIAESKHVIYTKANSRQDRGCSIVQHKPLARPSHQTARIIQHRHTNTSLDEIFDRIPVGQLRPCLPGNKLYVTRATPPSPSLPPPQHPTHSPPPPSN